MIDSQSHAQLREEVAERMTADREVLDQLRAEIRVLRPQIRRIQPRSTTAVSLVGTDGGNNKIQFDPFLVHLIRVVDSSNNEYCLEVVTPTTDTNRLSERQFNEDGSPKTALGGMMAFLGVSRLSELSPMIPGENDDRPPSPTWIQAYRELTEWAILFLLVQNRDFGTDTLIIFDGLLRSKVFTGDLFKRLRDGLREAIERKYNESRRRIYLVGVAKHSKVLARYRLAMALEEVLTTDYPAYVEIPRELEERVYIHSAYARGDEEEVEGGEINKFVAGKMFFVKFGNARRSPIWPVDIFQSQVGESQIILGFILADAINGFPVPFYPQCLQKAHENAALVDFDFDMLQDEIFNGIRQSLGDEAPVLDEFRLQDSDPAQARY